MTYKDAYLIDAINRNLSDANHNFGVSFEFFPPNSEEMEQAVDPSRCLVFANVLGDILDGKAGAPVGKEYG